MNCKIFLEVHDFKSKKHNPLNQKNVILSLSIRRKLWNFYFYLNSIKFLETAFNLKRNWSSRILLSRYYYHNYSSVPYRDRRTWLQFSSTQCCQVCWFIRTWADFEIKLAYVLIYVQIMQNCWFFADLWKKNTKFSFNNPIQFIGEELTTTLKS